MVVLRKNAPIRIHCVKMQTDDQPRGIRLLECYHTILQRRVVAVDIALSANDSNDSMIQFVDELDRFGENITSYSRDYGVMFVHQTIGYVNIEDRESQLFTWHDSEINNGSHLRCKIVDEGEYFLLQVLGRTSFVGIEKFDSGWYLSITDRDSSALFYPRD